MRRTEKAVYRQLLIGAIIGVLGLISIVMLIISAINPLVEYRGEAMRKSVMLAARSGEVFCQQLTPFSLGVMYTCFDSEAEPDAFARSL
jgi:hypothetical protein